MGFNQNLKHLSGKPLLLAGIASLLGGCSSEPQGTVIADFNNDGHQDIVYVVYDESVQSEGYSTPITSRDIYGVHDFYITTRAGSKTFLPPQKIFQIDFQLGQIWVDDLNRDGKKDLVFTAFDIDYPPEPKTFGLYIANGNGDGTFIEPSRLFTYEKEPSRF